MAIREIKRLTIVQQVVDGLKEYIMNGDVQVGDKLPTERELCQEFGVGRGLCGDGSWKRILCSQ